MAYTAEQKAMALAIYERHGELSSLALAEIREALELRKLGKTTVHRWVKAGTVPKSSKQTEQNGTDSKVEPKKKTPDRTPTREMIDTAHTELHKIYEELARKLLAHASQDDKIAELDSKQAITAAAIATDKMRLLNNLPTVIVGILPSLLENIKRAGHDPQVIFETLNARMLQAIEQQEVNLN